MIDLLGGVSSETVIGAVIAYFTSNKIENWMTEASEFLYYCVNRLWDEHDAKKGSCEFHLMDFPFTKVPNFYDKPVISWCKDWAKECEEEVYAPNPNVMA
jgi:hypothetical protein